MKSFEEYKHKLFGGNSHIRVIVKEDIKSPCCNASMYILNYDSLTNQVSSVIELCCSNCNKEY